MTTNETKIIAVETFELTKSYRRASGSFDALSELNLRVAEGEFVAIMGASGSGKSTALHLMAGLTRPTRGRVEIEGQDLSKMRDAALTKFRRRRVGVVFQSYNLIPHLTAEENILFPLRADGRRVDADLLNRLREFWKELGVEEQLGQYPDALSGGQQQRVAIARALATDPAVILADEPTGNLDWTSSQNVCEIFNRVNREGGRTIILVTHEPAVAIWSDRVVILRDGKASNEAPTRDFKDAGELARFYQSVAHNAPGGSES